jgi:hypothetical protein
MFEWAKEYDNHIANVATAIGYGKSESDCRAHLRARGLSDNGIRLVMWAAVRMCAEETQASPPTTEG